MTWPPATNNSTPLPIRVSGQPLGSLVHPGGVIKAGEGGHWNTTDEHNNCMIMILHAATADALTRLTPSLIPSFLSLPLIIIVTVRSNLLAS